MAHEQPNRFVEWYLALKEWVPTVWEGFLAWVEAVRAEPSLIWKTVAVRYAAYGVIGLMLLTIISSIPTWVVGPPPADAKPVAETADFYVICTNPLCREHFVVRRDKSFKKFPVMCPKCGQKTGVHAHKCWSDTCRGKWVAPVKIEKSLRCPECGHAIGP